MAEDQRKGEIFLKKIILTPRIWSCLCLVILLNGTSIALQDDTGTFIYGRNSRSETTEKSILASSEKTNNMISGANESTAEILKKNNSKKSTLQPISTQLNRPYPYLKDATALDSSVKDRLDNSIYPSKRSDNPDKIKLTGSLSVTVSESPTEYENKLEIETTTSSSIVSTTPYNSTEESTPNEDLYSDLTTTPTSSNTLNSDQADYTSSHNTQQTTEISLSTDNLSTTPVERTSTISEDATTKDHVGESSTKINKNKKKLTTVASTHQEETSTTIVDEEQTTVTTVTNPVTNTSATTVTNPATNTSATTVTNPVTNTSPTIVTNPVTETSATTVTNPVTNTSSTTVTNPVTETSATTVTNSMTNTPATTITDTMTSTVAMRATTMPATTTPTFMTTTPVPEVTMATITETTASTTSLVTTQTETSTEVTAVISILPTTLTTTLMSSENMPESTSPIPIVTTTSSTKIPSSRMTTKAITTVSSVSSEISNTLSTLQKKTSESSTEADFPTLPTEDVTLLIRIVFDGSWNEVCSKLPFLRESLAELLNNNVEKTVTPRQIIFHQTQCSINTPSSLSFEKPQTSLLLYIVDENGNFDELLTKILPSLYEKSPIEFPLTIHNFGLIQEADSGNVIVIVIVSSIVFICLILLAGLLFIMRKRQGRFNYGERCRPVSLDAYSLDSVSAYNSVRRSKGTLRASKRSYGNPTFEDSNAIPSHPLNFAGLSVFCNDSNAISEEFANIPQVSSKIDELPAGAEVKNRYANVIPLPETRVPLQRIGNDPLSEYINASYVRGPKNANKYYIACQAPTESTASDFWRMIWEQQSKVIIMLTDLIENGVEKCCEYIPPLEVSDCHRLYGDFQVTLKKREAKEKYAISTLHLKNLENNTFREVSHIWYLWPPNGVPTDASGLIAVLLEARALQRGAAGPIVVHCSPGTGRTGTLIALDLGIRQYEITRTVDVPRVVYTIRRDRAGAVQTREQYTFIYKGLNLYASKLAGGTIETT